MKKLSNKQIRTGLLTAALAGGTLLGATQVGGVVNAQVDEVDTNTPVDADDLTVEEREQRREEHQERREARREARMANAQDVAGLIGVEVEDIHEWIRGGGTLAEIAQQSGVSVDAVVDLIVDQKNERIDDAVENGRIEADEADEKRAEVEDIHEWVRGGGTLAEIAAQNDVSVDAVVNLIVEQKNERIDEAVENGRIEADEADEKRAEVAERVTTRVNEGRPERGEDEGVGPRGDRGDRGPRGGGGGAPADAPAADAEG